MSYDMTYIMTYIIIINNNVIGKVLLVKYSKLLLPTIFKLVGNS